MTRFVGYGKEKDKRILWQCTVFCVLWFLWMEQNARIFRDQFPFNYLLKDRMVFLPALWCKVWSSFTGVSLPHVTRDLEGASCLMLV